MRGPALLAGRGGALAAPLPPPPRRAAARLVPRGRAHLRPRATDGGGGKEPEHGRDWDAEWAAYSKGGGAPRPRGAPPAGGARGDAAAKKPPTFARRGAWNSGPQGDEIRRAESGLLDVWTSGPFFAVAGAVAVLLLVALVAGNPPPADSRCTLPWC
jgi:hypothetical protein